MKTPLYIFLSFLALILVLISAGNYIFVRRRFGREVGSKLWSNIYPVLVGGFLFLLLWASIPDEWGWPFILLITLTSTAGLWYRIIYLSWFAKSTGKQIVDLGPRKIIADRWSISMGLSGIFVMIVSITQPGLRSIGLLVGFLTLTCSIYIVVSGRHPRLVTDEGFYLYGAHINWQKIEAVDWSSQNEEQAYLVVTLIHKRPFDRVIILPIPTIAKGSIDEIVASYIAQD